MQLLLSTQYIGFSSVFKAIFWLQWVRHFYVIISICCLPCYNVWTIFLWNLLIDITWLEGTSTLYSPPPITINNIKMVVVQILEVVAKLTPHHVRISVCLWASPNFWTTLTFFTKSDVDVLLMECYSMILFNFILLVITKWWMSELGWWDWHYSTT